MDAEAMATRLAERFAEIESAVLTIPWFRQVKVNAVSGRTVDVELEKPTQLVKNIPMMTHHTAPSVGDVVWIVNVGRSRWLYLGKQG